MRITISIGLDEGEQDKTITLANLLGGSIELTSEHGTATLDVNGAPTINLPDGCAVHAPKE